MKRIVFMFLTLAYFVFAKVDYTQMSNEELIALIGYVADDKKNVFHKELNKRKKTFSQKEKELYEKNIKSIQER